MHDFFTRVWTDLIGRVEGPMNFRLILQPLTACILGIRAGVLDARANRPPLLCALIFHPEERRGMLRQSWKDTSKVFVFAVALDAAYQGLVLRAFYPGARLLAAASLPLVPASAGR